MLSTWFSCRQIELNLRMLAFVIGGKPDCPKKNCWLRVKVIINNKFFSFFFFLGGGGGGTCGETKRQRG